MFLSSYLPLTLVLVAFLLLNYILGNDPMHFWRAIKAQISNVDFNRLRIWRVQVLTSPNLKKEITKLDLVDEIFFSMQSYQKMPLSLLMYVSLSKVTPGLARCILTLFDMCMLKFTSQRNVVYRKKPILTSLNLLRRLRPQL